MISGVNIHKKASEASIDGDWNLGFYGAEPLKKTF